MKMTQFEVRGGHVQEDVNRNLGRAEKLKAVLERVCDQLVETLQLHLHTYLSGPFAAVETLTTTHRGRPGGCVHVAVTFITDDLKTLIETVKVLRCLSASGA